MLSTNTNVMCFKTITAEVGFLGVVSTSGRIQGYQSLNSMR